MVSVSTVCVNALPGIVGLNVQKRFAPTIVTKEANVIPMVNVNVTMDSRVLIVV